MTIMSFNSDLNKQDLEITFSRRVTKSYHSQTCFNNILGIYLNEKLNFYHYVCVFFIMYKVKKIWFSRLIFLLSSETRVLNSVMAT